MKTFKKNYGLIILLTLIPTFAYSELSLRDASEDYILNLFKLCKGYAQEDAVALEKEDNFLLTCINDELKKGYYNPINTLLKEGAGITN